MLVPAGADISAVTVEGKTQPLFAASQGNSPLLMAMAGRHLDLAKLLIDTNTNMAITRTDSVRLLSLAIVSQKEDVINVAFKHNPRQLAEQGTVGTVEAGSMLWNWSNGITHSFVSS